jgi:hypothetical protein
VGDAAEAVSWRVALLDVTGKEVRRIKAGIATTIDAACSGFWYLLRRVVLDFL